MNHRYRLAVGICLLLVLIVPRLFRRIDDSIAASQRKASEHEALYHDMTNLYPMAGELMADHPIHVRWKECRTKLLEAGYLETREVPIQDRLIAKGATWRFMLAFQKRFPGTECGVRAPKTDQAVAIITGPRGNFGLFGSIEAFVRQYRDEAP